MLLHSFYSQPSHLVCAVHASEASSRSECQSSVSSYLLKNDTGAHALDWFKNSAKFYRILLFRHEQGWGQLLATSKGLLTFGDDIIYPYILFPIWYYCY
jgi:hypothetical protein